MRIYGTYIVILVSFILESCSGDGYKTHLSGMKYKFFVENSANPKPVEGDVIVISMKYSTTNDSVLFDTKELGGTHFRMKVNKASHDGGTIDDALMMMHTGDSARFIVDAERFFTETKKTVVPGFIKQGDKLIFEIKLVEIFDYEEYLNHQKQSTVRTADEENRILKSYLENANITETSLNSGLYFIEKQKGKGSFPKQGQTVEIHYVASFINGEIFDSSLQRAEPFSFVFGSSQVIPGLEEGAGIMKPGGKATLIIPSHLAYGDQQYKMIPPFSTLIFEIELLNIK